MIIKTNIETIEWCRANSIALDASDHPNSISETEEFNIPADAGQRVAMVANQFEIFRNENNILVWFTEWSVWQSGERLHIFDRFRLSYGEKRHLIDSPGHLFTKDEFEDALSFVTLSVLFLWDCYVVNSNGTKILFYSHDEYGYKTN
jgi:hypothetical protein